tara:strand:+ start:99 stop:470 length:372 start_codon:yes stop_codon:yes gene_type:complete
MDEQAVNNIGCPTDIVHNALEDVERIILSSSSLIRDRSGKKYDDLWANYESSVTLLCEHYATSISLAQLLKSIIELSDMETLDNGIVCYVLAPVDVKIIFSLMAAMNTCESELLIHNISFGLH